MTPTTPVRKVHAVAWQRSNTITPAADFINELQQAFLKIPEDRRHSAQVHIEADDDGYGGTSADVYLMYDRPENAEERAKRERQDAAIREVQERNERAMFERLSAKFNPPKGD